MAAPPAPRVRIAPEALYHRALTLAVMIGILGASLFFNARGHDPFRTPKELFARGEAIVVGALLLIGLVWNWLDGTRVGRDRVVFGLTGAALLWTAITTATSTSVKLSLVSLVYVAMMATIFVGTYFAAARHRTTWLVWIVYLGAVPNAILAVLQELAIWNPVADQESIATSGHWSHMYTTALQGNPNDVAMFLLAPFIMSLAMAAVASRLRIVHGIVAVVLFGGLLATQSSAAIGALSVAVLALVLTLGHRKLLVAAIVGVLVLGGAFVALSPGAQRKVVPLLQLGGEDNLLTLDTAMSNRLVPFVAALSMARERPIFGVGPGCYGREYYPQKVLFELRHPELRRTATSYLVFIEAHNDHLQMLATTGVPGFALLIGALVVLARCSRRRGAEDEDECARFVRIVALPLALGFAVLALAQFPLELASPATMFLHAAALCVAWRRA